MIYKNATIPFIKSRDLLLALTHAASVTVYNQCSIPIAYHIDNNFFSVQLKNHALPAAGARDSQGAPVPNYIGTIYTASDDEEFYIVSYKESASCKITYAMIRDQWSIHLIFSGCDTTPKCELQNID